MSLSCFCDNDDADWYFTGADDFSILATKRSRKCCSCGTTLKPGSEVVRFERFRHPAYGSIEEKIVGEGNEIYMADWFMCEECGGLYMALSELKFCFDFGRDDMRDLAKEYGAMQREDLARKRAKLAKERAKP